MNKLLKLFYWKRLLPLCILIIGLIAFFSLGLNDYFSFDKLKANRTALINWTQAHYLLALLIYMTSYIIAVAISLPGATFLTLVAGFLFGIWLGTIVVVVSATLGSLAIFLAVRFAFEPWFAKKTNRWIAKMRNGFKRNAFQYLLFLRFIPLFPFWVVNIVPAILDVSITTYVITTFIGIIPGSLIYVFLGSGLGDVFDQNQAPHLDIIFTPSIFIPLLFLAILSLSPILYKSLKRKNR